MALTDEGVAQPRNSLASRRRVLIVAIVLFALVAFLLTRALGNSVLYFRTASEAVSQKAKLGAHRFRIEGTVVGNTVRQSGTSTLFAIADGGTKVDVVHQGDPPELFKPGIPVVLEGRWDGDHFASDRIMVKHSSQYRAQNPERVKDYSK